MKKHFNSLPDFQEKDPVNVDRENGILNRVEMAKFGKNKNRSYFNDKFLQDLALQGNAQSQGVKARFGHPAMCGNSFGTFIGRYKNFSVNNQKVYADLYLDPISKKTQVEGKGISMFDYIMDMSETNPDMFGNSIVINCDTFEEEIDVLGKKEKVESLILMSFVGSDLVDEPAATDAMFSANADDLGLITARFFDDNPKIFGILNEKPELISDFFERYFNYNRNLKPFNMNLNFKKLADLFSAKTFDKQITLSDGKIVTVVTDAEEAREGDQVNDADGASVGAGTHKLPDGGSIVTGEDGKITAINEKPEDPKEDPKDPASPEALMHSVNDLSKKFSAFMTAYDAEKESSTENFSHIAKAFEGIDAKFNLLGKSIKGAKPEEFEDDPKSFGKTKKSTGGYDADAAKEHHNKKAK